MQLHHGGRNRTKIKQQIVKFTEANFDFFFKRLRMYEKKSQSFGSCINTFTANIKIFRLNSGQNISQNLKNGQKKTDVKKDKVNMVYDWYKHLSSVAGLSLLSSVNIASPTHFKSSLLFTVMTECCHVRFGHFVLKSFRA